jgi:alkaline phosphatase
MIKLVLIFSLFVITYSVSIKDWSGDIIADKWRNNGKNKIDAVLNKQKNTNIAKNVILFLGDGMGITTVTSGRILKGQLKNLPGEEEITVMESLDDTALSKVISN